MTETSEDTTDTAESAGTANAPDPSAGTGSPAASSSEPAQSATVAASPQKAKHSKGALAAAIVCAAIAVVFAALFFTAQVPDNAAAKVNDDYIDEADVTSYIDQYRTANSLTDDTAFAQALASQSMTVSGLRINAINQLATNRLVNDRAAELGVTPSDDDVQERLDQTKSSLAFGDDATWQQTLQNYGLTEDQLREQYRTNLAQQAVCEKDVPRRDATDKQTLALVKANMVGSEQRHYYRIVFTGDDATKQAQACVKKLSAASAKGKLSLATFKKEAAQHANDLNGAYKWTIELDSSSELAQTLEDVAKGTISGAENVSDDNAVEVFYCDATYTFPGSKKIASLKKADVPASLWKALKTKAGDSVWNADCSAYIAKLLADAKITYYAMPDDATYNVDLQAATSSTSD